MSVDFHEASCDRRLRESSENAKMAVIGLVFRFVITVIELAVVALAVYLILK